MPEMDLEELLARIDELNEVDLSGAVYRPVRELADAVLCAQAKPSVPKESGASP